MKNIRDLDIKEKKLLIRVDFNVPLDEQGDMLIIAHDEWLDNVQPLVEHRNLVGIPTFVQNILIGSIIIGAVALDRFKHKRNV